jgi:hypothetical protein
VIHDCTCLYDAADGDQPAFHAREWRKARKTHTCCECRRAIQRGERYEHFSGKWERRMEVYKTCAACQDTRQSLYCEGWTFGQLWEDVEEQIFRETGLTIACIDKLATVEGKTYLQQRWMEYVEER